MIPWFCDSMIFTSLLWFRYRTPVSWCTGQSAGACKAIQDRSKVRADASTGQVRTHVALLQAGRLAPGSKGKRCLRHWHLPRQDGGKEMGLVCRAGRHGGLSPLHALQPSKHCTPATSPWFAWQIGGANFSLDELCTHTSWRVLDKVKDFSVS